MLEDERISQVYDEYEKKVEPTSTDFLKKIPTNVKIIVGIAAVFLLWQMFIGKQDLKTILIFFALFVGFLWLVSRGEFSKRLTEQEIKISLFKKLKWKQRNPLGGFYEIPEGRIKIGPPCNLLTIEGKPWRWPVAFRIEEQGGLEKMYVADMDPFTGDVLSIVDADRGFKGDERPHIRFIDSPELRAEKRYYERVGRTPPRR